MNNRRIIGHLQIFAGAMFLLAGTVQAQGYPDRPITLVVPFATGNIADNQGRLAAQYLADGLGRPVIVVNKPGAGGTIGTDYVIRAPADGYTLLYGTHGTQAANSALYPNSKTNPAQDLRGVHSLFRQSTVLVTPANRPWRNLEEMLVAAREKPEKISYASSGIGTQTHLAAAQFQEATNTRLLHIPYNNQSSMTDLLAGNVDLSFSYAESVQQYVANGKLRALAINGKTRMTVLPDVPTVGEAGYPEAALEGWSGIFAPRKTPDAIVTKIANVIETATQKKEVETAMARIGSYPMNMSDAAFQSFVEKEVPRWRNIVEKAGAATH